MASARSCAHSKDTCTVTRSVNAQSLGAHPDLPLQRPAPAPARTPRTVAVSAAPVPPPLPFAVERPARFGDATLDLMADGGLQHDLARGERDLLRRVPQRAVVAEARGVVRPRDHALADRPRRSTGRRCCCGGYENVLCRRPVGHDVLPLLQLFGVLLGTLLGCTSPPRRWRLARMCPAPACQRVAIFFAVPTAFAVQEAAVRLHFRCRSGVFISVTIRISIFIICIVRICMCRSMGCGLGGY